MNHLPTISECDVDQIVVYATNGSGLDSGLCGGFESLQGLKKRMECLKGW